MDVRARQAREQHQCAENACRFAKAHRQQRDQLIRELRTNDPAQWSYRELAKAVGCSKSLIKKILEQEKDDAQTS